MHRHGCQDAQMAHILHKNCITLMDVIRAAGDHAAPLFVLKGSSIPYRILIRGGIKITESPASYLPTNAVFAMRTENRGVDSTTFLNWAAVFVRYIAPLHTNNRKVLLVYDGYRSHLSLQVLKLFHKKIDLWCTPFQCTLPGKHSLWTLLCLPRLKHPSTKLFRHVCLLLQDLLSLFMTSVQCFAVRTVQP